MSFDINFDYALEVRERRAGEIEFTSFTRVCDEIVLDGYWHQLLGPGHLARLGGPPEGSVPIGNGWASLTVGEPEVWAGGGAQRDHLRAQARALLAPCLLGGEHSNGVGEAADIMRRRPEISDEELDRRMAEVYG